MQSLTVGAAWAWRGDAVRVDGPQSVLRLDGADGSEAMRRRAARMVGRLVGAALDHQPIETVTDSDDARELDSSFVVTDGAKSYTVTMIEVGRGSQPLLMFLDALKTVVEVEGGDDAPKGSEKTKQVTDVVSFRQCTRPG